MEGGGGIYTMRRKIQENVEKEICSILFTNPVIKTLMVLILIMCLNAHKVLFWHIFHVRNSNYRVDLLVEHVVDEYVGHGGLQLQQTEKRTF